MAFARGFLSVALGLFAVGVAATGALAQPAGAPGDEGPAPALVLKGHTADLGGAAWSPDGSKVVTASSDHTARIWDAKTGAVLAVLAGHEESVRNAAFSPDGKLVVTASRDGSAKVWDAATGKELVTLAGHAGMLEHAGVEPRQQARHHRLARQARDRLGRQVGEGPHPAARP